MRNTLHFLRKITPMLALAVMLFLDGSAWGQTTIINENIQSWTNRVSYGNYTQAISAGTVNMTACIVANAASATGTCSAGRVQMNSSTGIIVLPALATVGTAEFHLAAGAASRTVKLQKYNGSTWDDLTTFTGIGTTGATYSYAVNLGSSTILRLASPSNALYVHDIIVTDYGTGNTITLSPATQDFGPFCNSTANSVALNYTTEGTVTAPFIQLSNASGSFASGTANLGGTISGSGPYTITTDIPAAQAAGSYKIRIVSTDATPVVSADNGSNIIVSAPATPTVSINDPGTICNNESVTFTPVPTNLGGGSATYSWTINGAAGAATGANYTQSSWTQGNSVQAVMTVTGGCVTANTASSAIVTPTVTIPVTPEVSIAITSGSNPSCAGSSVTFTATPTNLGGGTVNTYQWKVNGGNVGSNLATYTTTSLANTNQVTCDITVNGGCITASTASSTAITMTINALPATPTAGSNSPICAGGTLNLTTNATGTIAWTGPNSFTSSVQNPTITNVTAASAGTYSVTSNNGTCTSAAGTTTIVINTPPAITTQPASGSTTVGGSKTFSVVATGTGLTYQWKLNGTDINLATSSSYTVSGATLAMNGNSYTVVVSGTCSPSVTSDAAVFTVLELPCGGTETFNNSNFTTSVSSGSFAGDVVTWNYTSCRTPDPSGITGTGCMLAASTSAKLTSGNLSGIGNFTCKLKKGFTGAGNRQVALYINGNFAGASLAWDNTTTQTFTVNNINIAGGVVIEIRNTAGYATVIDDISWTCYAPPSTPTATAATAVTSTGFTANWNSVVGATSYKLDVSPVDPFTTNTNIINEDFVLCTGNVVDITSNLNSKLNLPGWTGTQVYEATGKVRLGSGGTAGVLTTPTIDLSNGTTTLSFDLWYYDANTAVEVFHAANGTTFTSVATFVAPVSQTTISVNITGGTASSKIRIQAVTAANQRYFLDNFIVTKTVNNSLAGYKDLAVSSGTSQLVTGLSSNTTYYYRVRAVGANGTSANSNVIEVTTRSPKVTIVNGEWNTAAIWSPVGIPDALDDVTIDHAVTIGVDKTADCHNMTIGTGSLTIESSATGTGSLITTGTVTGNVDVQRYLTGGWSVWNSGWHQISSPVAAQPISAFATGNYDFYGWNEPKNEWTNYKQTSDFTIWNGDLNFKVGGGYWISYEAGTKTQTYTGELNNTDVTFENLTVTAASAANSGWHLMGNPFASAIKWNDGSWTLDNVTQSAKIWKEAPKSYADIEENEIIPSAQGFMVQVQAGNKIIIPAASRVHDATPYYKSGKERLLLVAGETEGGSAQESKILLNPMATEGFDFKYDSRFLAGYAPLFYSVVGDEMLSTNSLPELNSGKVIPFGFVKNAASAFTITLKESIPGRVVYLTDNKTGTVTNLTETQVYNFTSDDGDDANRFLITFGTLGINNPEVADAAQVYAYGEVLYVVNSSKEAALINVYNLTGQLVMQAKTGGETLSTFNAAALNNGIYVVNVIFNQGVISQKVVIRK